jgi:hypothetical protein
VQIMKPVKRTLSPSSDIQPSRFDAGDGYRRASEGKVEEALKQARLSAAGASTDASNSFKSQQKPRASARNIEMLTLSEGRRSTCQEALWLDLWCW